MNNEKQEDLPQTPESELKDAGGYVLGLDGMEMERCSRKRPDKLESKLGNCREKIKKSHKEQTF